MRIPPPDGTPRHPPYQGGIGGLGGIKSLRIAIEFIITVITYEGFAPITVLWWAMPTLRG